MLELKKLVPELKGISISSSIRDCHACKIGKSPRIPHVTVRTLATQPLQIVHTDVMDKVHPLGFPDRERYFLVIVDDFTHFVYVYTMTDKKSVHVGFQSFLDLMRRSLPIPHSVGLVRMDNGREYMTTELTAYFKRMKIQPDPSPAYTSPLNGKAERMIRTVQNMVRTMIEDSGFPKRMWPLAARYAGNLLNFLPSSAVNNSIPYTNLLGKPPPLHYVKRFGAVSYATARPHRGKFEGKTERKFFVGIQQNAALLLTMPHGKITPVSNVRFVESRVYGHFYGPFEQTSFRDPIDLLTSSRDTSQIETQENLDDPVDDRDELPVKRPRSSHTEPSTPLVPREPIQTRSRAALKRAPLHRSTIEWNPELTRVSDSQALVPTTRAYFVLEARYYLQQSLLSHIRPDPDFSQHLLQPIEDDLEDEDYNFVLLAQDTCDREPLTFHEAIRSRDAPNWKSAMDVEFAALDKTGTWEVVRKDSIPKGTRIIDSTWVYKIKYSLTTPDPLYRARLVARGFKDLNRYDISEIYAPVVEQTDVRILLSQANKAGLFLRQLDIKTAFLHGVLEKPVYMSLPDGFPDKLKLKSHYACRLIKSLYGLKVSPKRWFERFRETVLVLGFQPFWLKPCIFLWKKNNNYVILALYVDDILLLGNNSGKLNQVMRDLGREFDIKDLGEPCSFLGMQISRNPIARTIFLHHEKYIQTIIARLPVTVLRSYDTPILTADARRHQKSSAPGAPPNHTVYRMAVGSLIHLANGTRPDICFAVNTVSRAQANPTSHDWDAILRIFGYLQQTPSYGLLYRGATDDIICYADASLGTSDPNGRSTSGYALYVHGDLVSWRSKKQTHVALSSAEAEYIAASLAARKLANVRAFYKFITSKEITPILKEDNRTCIALAKSLEAKSLQHVVNLCYNYVRFEFLNGNLTLDWVKSDEQLADILTKPLAAPRFRLLTEQLVVPKPHSAPTSFMTF